MTDDKKENNKTQINQLTNQLKNINSGLFAAQQGAQEALSGLSKFTSSYMPNVSIPTLNDFEKYVKNQISGVTIKKTGQEPKQILNVNVEKGSEQEVKYDKIYLEKTNLDLSGLQSGKEPEEIKYSEIYLEKSTLERGEDKYTKTPEYDMKKYRAGEYVANLVHGNVKNKLDFVKYKDSSNPKLKDLSASYITDVKKSTGPNTVPSKRDNKTQGR